MSGLHGIRRSAAVLTLALVISSTPARASEPTAFDPVHAAWTELLQRRVKDGFVDYVGLKTTDQAALDRYLASLGKVSRETYVGWPREARLAFWINVYNAFTVKLILDHHPLKSIRSIGFLPGSAFRETFVSLPGMRKERYSLNEVEHDILRQEFREPRIHFAIVCASKSCPALRAEAYRAAELDAQLDNAARGFLTDASKNRVDGSILWLSSIFKWFGEDFEKSAGSVERFVAPYLGLESGSRHEIEFLDYDWSLNGR